MSQKLMTQTFLKATQRFGMTWLVYLSRSGEAKLSIDFYSSEKKIKGQGSDRECICHIIY